MDYREQEANIVRNALITDHANRNTPGVKIPLPQGKRVSAKPFMGIPMPGEEDNLVLGDPTRFLIKTEPGKYIWRKRDDPKTSAWVAAQRMRPVLMEEINRSNPDVVAVVSGFKSATGEYVLWENLALFLLYPKWAYRNYDQYEDYSQGRVAQRAQQFEEEIETQSEGKYKGTFKKEKA